MTLTVRFKAGDSVTTTINKLNQRGFPVVTSVNDIVDPFYGQIIFNLADNSLYRYSGTMFVPLSGPQLPLQLADTTVNNTASLEDTPDLVAPVVADGSYVLEAQIIVDSSAAADSVVSFTGPVGSGIRLAFWQDGLAASAINGNLFHDAVDLPSVQIGGIASGTLMTCRPSGWFINGPNPGTLTVQFAQNVATVLDTKLKAGSWMRLTKVNTD